MANHISTHLRRSRHEFDKSRVGKHGGTCNSKRTNKTGQLGQSPIFGAVLSLRLIRKRIERRRPADVSPAARVGREWRAGIRAPSLFGNLNLVNARQPAST